MQFFFVMHKNISKLEEQLEQFFLVIFHLFNSSGLTLCCATASYWVTIFVPILQYSKQKIL